MQTYDNWAKYFKGFSIAACVFFILMTLLYMLQIRTGLNPLVWLVMAVISAVSALVAHIINERIAIKEMTGFSNKKELQKENLYNYQVYKKACGDDSLAEFVLQEMTYLKNDIKQYIFIRDLSTKLEEIKNKQ